MLDLWPGTGLRREYLDCATLDAEIARSVHRLRAKNFADILVLGRCELEGRIWLQWCYPTSFALTDWQIFEAPMLPFKNQCPGLHGPFRLRLTLGLNALVQDSSEQYDLEPHS